MTKEEIIRDHDRRKIDLIVNELKVSQDEVNDKLIELTYRMETMSIDLVNHKGDVQQLSTELQRIGDSLRSIRELLEAWNNAKGFIVVMKFISGAVKILSIIAVGAAVLGASFMYLRGKLGL